MAPKLTDLVAATAVLFACALVTSAEAADCALSEADKAANEVLSFNDFDQAGTTPKTARKLAEARCYEQAAEATEHYLIHASGLSEGQRRVLTFHLGQQLALAGKRREAARLIASSKNSAQAVDVELDWNAYVDGVWGYMAGDRDELRAAIAALAPLPGNNRINLLALKGLDACFDRDYETASAAPCRPSE